MMPPRDLAQRFWEKVDRSDPDACWVWGSAIDRNGYGRIQMGRGRLLYAHRIALQLSGVAIPDGMVVDHLCRNRPCVNPRHLQAVTHAENMRRGMRAQQAACKQGHPLAGDNLYVWTDRQGRAHRHCRTCRKARRHEREARARTA